MAQAKRHNSDAWREALKIISRCPVCSTPYNATDARIFARAEAATLVHIACGSCQSFFVAMVVLLGGGVSSVGMVTDLSYQDIARLHRAESIDTDALIDGYLTIHNPDLLQQLV